MDTPGPACGPKGHACHLSCSWGSRWGQDGSAGSETQPGVNTGQDETERMAGTARGAGDTAGPSSLKLLFQWEEAIYQYRNGSTMQLSGERALQEAAWQNRKSQRWNVPCISKELQEGHRVCLSAWSKGTRRREEGGFRRHSSIAGPEGGGRVWGMARISEFI